MKITTHRDQRFLLTSRMVKSEYVKGAIRQIVGDWYRVNEISDEEKWDTFDTLMHVRLRGLPNKPEKRFTVFSRFERNVGIHKKVVTIDLHNGLFLGVPQNATKDDAFVNVMWDRFLGGLARGISHSMEWMHPVVPYRLSKSTRVISALAPSPEQWRRETFASRWSAEAKGKCMVRAKQATAAMEIFPELPQIQQRDWDLGVSLTALRKESA